jgi:hypothetical protein
VIVRLAPVLQCSAAWKARLKALPYCSSCIQGKRLALTLLRHYSPEMLTCIPSEAQIEQVLQGFACWLSPSFSQHRKKAPDVGGFLVLGLTPISCAVLDNLAAVLPLHYQAFRLTFPHDLSPM